MTRILCYIILSSILLLSAGRRDEPKERLSEYNFFTGKLADMTPGKNVTPYQLNTPLFSDYAEKARFIYLPEGETVPYNADSVLAFPKGTVLIKTFYYPQPTGRRLMETRLLLHENDGWKALVYIWNDEQTEAFLEVAGDRKPMTYQNKSFDYIIPNLNQCKGCHNTRETMQPIGPTARQLNGDFAYTTGKENQLTHLAKLQLLTGLPGSDIPRAPVWNDPSTGSLNDRARIWLDVNCGHCHKPDGPARTSALFLNIDEQNPTHLGIFKTPVAAGRGSGNRQFNIVPGQPDKSILAYRMESTDPGVMMPELGRKLNHTEGIELVKEWIRKMETTK